MTAGNFDYLPEVHTRDVAHYRALLAKRISRLPNVRQTHTLMVMETVKDESTLTVPQRG